MKQTVIILSLLVAGCFTVQAQEQTPVQAKAKAYEQDTYFTMDEMPDLVKCLPAPPDTTDPAFANDVMRYEWGKMMRSDAKIAARVERDAIWVLDTLVTIFSEPFGLKITAKDTPAIYKALTKGIYTGQLIRVRPKAHFHRIRPFEYFNEHVLNPWEEGELRGEGSYPSGHTIRGWLAALILAEINPAAANELYARGWEYGVIRVISGAHWQSDVDASRPIASITYSLLQTSPEFRRQMDKAKKEFARKMRASKKGK